MLRGNRDRDLLLLKFLWQRRNYRQVNYDILRLR